MMKIIVYALVAPFIVYALCWVLILCIVAAASIKHAITQQKTIP